MLSAAAGDDQVGFAAADRPRRHRHRVEARAAQAVEGDAARAVGKAGEQPGHAREVAIVLAGLVGAAEDDVVELGPVDARVAVDQRADRDRGEVVGADAAERPAVAADRGADGVADEGFGHHVPRRPGPGQRDRLRILPRPSRDCI